MTRVGVARQVDSYENYGQYNYEVFFKLLVIVHLHSVKSLQISYLYFILNINSMRKYKLKSLTYTFLVGHEYFTSES